MLTSRKSLVILTCAMLTTSSSTAYATAIVTTIAEAIPGTSGIALGTKQYFTDSARVEFGETHAQDAIYASSIRSEEIFGVERVRTGQPNQPIMDVGPFNVYGISEASADLMSGKLKAYAFTSYNFGIAGLGGSSFIQDYRAIAEAGAQISETLSFNVPDPLKSQDVYGTLYMDVHGLASFDGPYGFAGLQVSSLFGSEITRILLDGSNQQETISLDFLLWSGQRYNTFGTGSFNVMAMFTLFIDNNLSPYFPGVTGYDITGGNYADYRNTGTIRMVLPSGVSYTSGTGVFLANQDNPIDVPEPGTLALLGSAFIGLVILRRRKHA